MSKTHVQASVTNWLKSWWNESLFHKWFFFQHSPENFWFSRSATAIWRQQSVAWPLHHHNCQTTNSVSQHVPSSTYLLQAVRSALSRFAPSNTLLYLWNFCNQFGCVIQFSCAHFAWFADTSTVIENHLRVILLLFFTRFSSFPMFSFSIGKSLIQPTLF